MLVNAMYERVQSLGKELGLTVQSIEMMVGISRGSVAKWRTSIPRADILSRVAALLKTTSEYLLTGEGPAHPDAQEQSIKDYLQEIKDDPDKRMMFDLAKDATIEEIKATVAFLELLKGKRTEE